MGIPNFLFLFYYILYFILFRCIFLSVRYTKKLSDSLAISTSTILTQESQKISRLETKYPRSVNLRLKAVFSLEKKQVSTKL